MLKLTCIHLEVHELTKSKQKQSESGSVCMTSTLIGCIYSSVLAISNSGSFMV